MKKHFTDRSRTECALRCKRMRYWNYEFNGRGIEPTRRSLALVVGGCVHEGLAVALWQGQQFMYRNTGREVAHDTVAEWRAIEEQAVAAALREYNEFLVDSKLELDAREQAELAETVKQVTGESVVDFSAEFGLSEEQAKKFVEPNRSAEQQEKYLEVEQRNLVEGMVRAYCRRRLLPLLDEFEVLEVEREGEWLLSEWDGGAAHEDVCGYCDCLPARSAGQLWWMSRPDALLRHRTTNDLHIMSFKTTGAWDVRKERDALRDMQGLSEGVEIERRLGEWWDLSRNETARVVVSGSEYAFTPDKTYKVEGDMPEPIRQYLVSVPAPPRISAIRYEYLLKGERDKKSRAAKSLSERIGLECRIQQSPLLYVWVKEGMTSHDQQFAHSFSYTGADGKEHKLYWKDWNQKPVWEQMTMREWVDLLESGQVQPEVQADVLAEQFIAPMTVFRNDDDLRDWIESTEAQEVAIVQDAEKVAKAGDEEEKRHLLNVLFPMTRRACEYPGTCQYVTLCYGTPEQRADPLASGRFRERQVNHPQEVANVEAK